MGQQQTTTEAGGTLRRILLVVAAATLMAAIMMVTTLTAVAAPKSNPAKSHSAAGQCGPPGASVSHPELPTDGIPGQKIRENCAPGQG